MVNFNISDTAFKYLKEEQARRINQGDLTPNMKGILDEIIEKHKKRGK